MAGLAYDTVSTPASPDDDVEGPRPAADSPTGERVLARVARPVLMVHIATLVAGFGTWMYLDRHLWFYGDEWDFIVLRGVFHPQKSIWAPHNEHWSTLPILAWRAIFNVVHLAHYWPYLAALLLLHVFVVHLFWRRCLREGVDPWLATALGLLVVLLGTAAEDLTWAFQIGFLGSLAFGLIALELLESRRSALLSVGASLAAVASLMCSDIGVAMLATFAVVALARRGWRPATALVAPPALAFAIWFALIGHTGLAGDPITRHILFGTPGFVWHDIRTDLARIFRLAPIGLSFMAPVLIIGLVVWLAWGGRRLLREHPVTVALLAGDLVFHILTAVGRARLGATFSPSRYVYIDSVFLLPVFAVALSWRPKLARARLAPALRDLVLVLLAACTASNMVQGVGFARARTTYVLLLKQEIVGSAQLLARGQKAIAVHPISFAGLTPPGMLSMEHRHLLPKLDMTVADRYTDETVLDVTIAKRRLVPGTFSLVTASKGVMVRPAGTGCLAVRARRGARSPSLLFRLSGRGRSAATDFIGRTAKLRAFVVPGRRALPGQVSAALIVPPGGGWLSDDVAGDRLLVAVPGGRSRFCGLGPSSVVTPGRGVLAPAAA